jgi:hypothetical protein
MGSFSIWTRDQKLVCFLELFKQELNIKRCIQIFSSTWLVAQRITRLTTDQKIAEFIDIFFLFIIGMLDAFTRCDIVGTWSREYQLSSSSHSNSNSYSYSPEDSLFLVFNKWDKIFNNFLTAFWQLFENFLTTFLTNFLTNFCQFFENFLTTFLTTFWQLFEIFWQLVNNFLTTFWLFFILIVLPSYGNKYFKTNFIYAVPTSLLIAPGLWTI